MQPIENLKSQIAKGKISEQGAVDIWHSYMMAYGWIPFDEFFSLDAHIVNRLGELLEEMYKEQTKSQGNLPKTLRSK